MLEVSNLGRLYGDMVAVDNVSFNISKGEIVGLLGHNGAGKTTIMKMVSGFLEPSSGTVKIDQFSLDDQMKEAQKQLGYLPESLPVYPEMVVADYLDYAANLKGLSGDEKWQEIKRAMIATDITEKSLSPIANLSRGFKQRVGVAQAIIGKPKLLILDEPTNGLDPTQTQHMRALIREVAKDATVILSTHIMQEVDALCDRVLILKQGALVVDESLESLRSTNYIHLETAASEEELKAITAKNSSVHSIGLLSDDSDTSQNSTPTVFRYRLEIAEGTNIQQCGSEIASALINNHHPLFKLLPESRDLESLFREVNTKEDAQHAA